MKALFISGILFCFAGCGTVQQMNSNMQEMNGTLEQNIGVMESSKEKIQENTQEVIRSTNQMAEFKRIISSSTATINGGVDNAKEHTALFPFIFIAILALVFLPTVICIIFYHKFFQKMKSNLKSK